MSLEAYIWAGRLPLAFCNGTSHRVLLMLADRADELGYNAWPSVQSMAGTLICSTRTIQRALRDLAESGLIREGDQRLVSHIRPDRRPVVYDVLTDALIAAEARRGRGDIPVTPSRSRGDSSCPSGVTTAVTQTVQEPSYQDSLSDTPNPAAREIVTSR